MTSLISRPARVGLITDQTGALSFMGVANVNLAKMVTDDINARGGLLGRPVELYVEDSATDDEIAHTAAARSSCSSRTARPTTRSPRPGLRSSSSESASTWWSAGSTARPARRSNARWSTRPRSSTSTRSSTKVSALITRLRDHGQDVTVRPVLLTVGSLPQLLDHISAKEQQRAPRSEPRNWRANARILMTIQDFLIADSARHAIPRMQAAHPIFDGDPYERAR